MKREKLEVEKEKKIKKNMFGIDKKMKSFTEKDEAEFEGGRA